MGSESNCGAHLGAPACSGLERCYVLFWGIAQAFFIGAPRDRAWHSRSASCTDGGGGHLSILGACLVSLGSLQLFSGPASEAAAHFMFASSEGYQRLSFFFISVGFGAGLMPGASVNALLRFPQYPYCCAVHL